jgi:hypothetical protein
LSCGLHGHSVFDKSQEFVKDSEQSGLSST